MNHRPAGVVLTLLAGVALVACNGAAATGVPASSTVQTSVGPSSASGSTAPSSGSGAAATAGASTDVGLADQNIANLDSYQAHITSPTGSADIIVVRKPSFAESFIATNGGHKTRLVIIGTTDWLDSGTGKFVKNAIPASAVAGMTGLFDPGTILSAFAKQKILGLLTQVGSESKNGVDTIHFHGDQNTPGINGETIPPGGMVDVWVAASGDYLVALEATGLKSGTSSGNFSIEMTNINDPANSVSPPA
jgi:hypothetical protein